MKRPALNQIPLDEAMKAIFNGGIALITMSPGLWSGLLAESYDQGLLLLELDDNETPIAAYRKVTA